MGQALIIGSVGLSQTKTTLLIAGRGDLPQFLLAAAQGPVCLIALQGFADTVTCARADHILPLGHLGAMIEAGKQAGATQVAFAGGLDRPPLNQIDFDTYAHDHLDQSALRQGDDAALRAIAHLFHHAGFALVGPLDFAADLAMPAGPLGGAMAPEFEGDIQRGAAVAKALGAVDVGQGVVVQQGLVLAVEGIEGTDALIARGGQLARPGQRPILVKAAKPQQDLRLDMPTFGPETLNALRAANFAGAVLEAGKTLVLDQKKLIQEAQKAKLFITGQIL